MAPGYVFQVSLRVTVQNQVRIAQRIVVDEVVQFRPLRLMALLQWSVVLSYDKVWDVSRWKQGIHFVFQRKQNESEPFSYWEKVRILLLWCTSRTHIRTFLRFHSFPEIDRFCTFLIVKGNKHLIIVEIDGIDEGIHQFLPLFVQRRCPACSRKM